MGVPLVALSVRTPPTPQDVDLQMQQIRGMLLGQQYTAAATQGQQLQNQQSQLNLATQRQVVLASHDPAWDPTDPDSVLKTLTRYNVPLQAQANVMGGIRAIQSGLNAVSKENLEALDNAHSFIDDQLQGAKNAPQDTREKAYQGALGNIAQYAQNLAPNMRQAILKEVSGAPPIFDSQWVDMKHGLLKTEAALTKDALEKAQTAEAAGRGAQSQAEAQLSQARIPGAQAESTIQGQQADMTPQQRALSGNLFYGAAGGDPQSRQALGLETGQKVAAAQAGVAGAPSALRGVPVHLVPAATADATKAGQDYAQALQASDDMKSMLNLAKNQGNKVAYAYAPVTGVLQINAAGQTKRINMGEISKYGSAGSAADRVMGFLGKQTSGASIPPDVLNDMDAVQQSIATGANSKYQRDLNVVNQNYGSKFTPVDMGGASAPGGQSLPSGNGKMIDRATAMQFYDAAGNDPRKAEALAIQNGWKVR